MMLSRLVALLVLGFLLCGAALAGAGVEVKQPSSGERDELRSEVAEYLHLLNEFSERRRADVLFPNDQTPTYGVPLSFVNVGRGNATFKRVDLAVVGRIPLIAARIYDSSLDQGADFGPGWRLSIAETIREAKDGLLVYTDGTASRISFRRTAGGLEPVPAGPWAPGLQQTATDQILLRTANGTTKTFTQG